MVDGVPAHTVGLTQSYQDHYHIPLFVWSPSSPDFNPIENICRLLKTRLNARNPRPKGKEEVRSAILDEWEQISEEEILKFVDIMPQRIHAFIAAEGGHTRWQIESKLFFFFLISLGGARPPLFSK